MINAAFAAMHTDAGRFGYGLLAALDREDADLEARAAVLCLAHALQCAAGWERKRG